MQNSNGTSSEPDRFRMCRYFTANRDTSFIFFISLQWLGKIRFGVRDSRGTQSRLIIFFFRNRKIMVLFWSRHSRGANFTHASSESYLLRLTRGNAFFLSLGIVFLCVLCFTMVRYYDFSIDVLHSSWRWFFFHVRR